MEVLSFYMSNIFFTPFSVVLRAFVSTKFAIIRYVAPTEILFFRRTDFDFDFDFEQIHRSTTRKYPIAEKQRNINVSKHEKLLGLNLNRINFHVRWSRVL